MNRIFYLLFFFAASVSTLSASQLDLGISGGSHIWGNATWERTQHQSTAQTGQYDLGLFLEYGKQVSGRIELRYISDYLTQKADQNFSFGPASGNYKTSLDLLYEEVMMPLLIKMKIPVADKWRVSFFGGPEICLYRQGSSTSDFSVTYDPPYQTFNSSAKSGHLSVVPWEPRYSIGGLVGGGIGYDFGQISLGLNLNAEFVRLTGEGNNPGDSIDHRYNIQLDLAYALFRNKN